MLYNTMKYPILVLVFISNVIALDYLLVGYNYADVCCNVTKISAVELQYGDEVSTIVTPPLLKNTPTSDFITDSTITTLGTKLRIGLTKKMGFVIGHWYVVCFGTENDSPGHCSLFRPCDCECTENAWVQINITLESVLNTPPEKNQFYLGYDVPKENGHQGVRTPSLDFATTREAYDSCPEHGWTNLGSSVPIAALCTPGTFSASGGADMFPRGGSSRIGIKLDKTITEMAGTLDVLFDVEKIPAPYTMDNYIQKIGVYTIKVNTIERKLNSTHYIRIIGNPVNTGEIDYNKIKQVCEEIKSDELNTIKANAAVKHDENSAKRNFSHLTIFATAVVMLCW